MTFNASVSRPAAVTALVMGAALSMALFTGCAQSEAPAGAMTTESATPTGTTGAPAVAKADDNSVKYQLDLAEVTPELENLKSDADVAAYVDELENRTKDIEDTFNRASQESMGDANALVAELRNLSFYIPTLKDDGTITADEENTYNARVDGMLLDLDALLAS